MSRSYRSPWVTDGQRSHGRGYKRKHPRYLMKRWSNRETRKNWDLLDGMAYKRNGYSWNICDWKFYCSKYDERDYLGHWTYERAIRK